MREGSTGGGAPSYQVGVDIGGTFTDCVLLGGEEPHLGKSLTTHGDLSTGFFDALEIAAEKAGTDASSVLPRAEFIFHGTTVGTNAMIERSGARTGLLTTRGAGDVLLIRRAHGRVAGRPIDEVAHASIQMPPRPLVPRRLIEEVAQRHDYAGREVVALDEDEALAAVARLVDRGIDALAISFLWSFQNPEHELRAAALARERFPDLYVTCSSDLVPKWGEYERTSATAVNCYVGPPLADYLAELLGRLEERRFAGRALILQCAGSVMTPEAAAASALLTIDSGPAGGITGSAQLASAAGGSANVICTDMGGTSFDVGLIVGGQPVRTSTTVVGQYTYSVPKIDIRSVGTGGGSYIRFDEISRSLKVGPDSAGADPGPVCYGRGGTVPTITDADVVLGYLNPEHFAGGRVEIDPDAARSALAELGEPLGLDAVEVAAGAIRISDARMADLIRQLTVQQGKDPREFEVFAYGGAGPLHAAGYTRELGGARVVVPRGDFASSWSAFGAALSDVGSVLERTRVMAEPLDAKSVNAVFGELDARAAEVLEGQGVAERDRILRRSVDVRYAGQIYEVEIPLEAHPCGPEDLERLEAGFVRRYEELYGEGAGFPGAGIELVNFRVEAIGRVPKPPLQEVGAGEAEPPGRAAGRARDVYWTEFGEWRETPVFLGGELLAGNEVAGPAIVDMPDTTVVVRPGMRAAVDRLGSVLLDLEGS
jgi:N-methylhydantoinase A